MMASNFQRVLALCYIVLMYNLAGRRHHCQVLWIGDYSVLLILLRIRLYAGAAGALVLPAQ